MEKRNGNPVLGALLGFLEQPEKCDVKFNVHLGGDAWMPFWGHKLILSIWSPVFAAHFSEKEVESFSEIDIDGYPPTVFKHFLKFMYGSSEGICENKSNGKFLLNLYKLAELYQVEQLKKDCRKILIAATVEFENVFQFLNAANYIDLEIVKLRCLELIRDKTVEVIAVQDLKKITSSMIFTILKLDTLSLSSEYDLLLWVFDWAENECNKFPQAKPKEIIEPFLPFLNFASLKPEAFAALVNKHKDFFEENDGFRIFLNICDPGPSCMPLPSWHSKAKSFRSYKILNCEEKSKNLLSNNTQKDTKSVEQSSSVDTTVDEPINDSEDLTDNTPTELVNQSVNGPSNNTQKDTKSVEQSSSVDTTVDEPINDSEDLTDNTPTELVNQSENGPNSKPDCLTDNTAADTLLENPKQTEYCMDCMADYDSLNSLEQVAIYLAESSLLASDEENNELNYYSLNDYIGTGSQMALDCSRLRRKIKKKKVKKWYLLPEGKTEPVTKSLDALNNEYSSDFQSLIGTIWKQRLSNI